MAFKTAGDVGVVKHERGVHMDNEYRQESTAWMVQVWVSFIASTTMMVIGIWSLPVDVWAKGYLAMGLLFTVGSCFSLAKHVRDQLEGGRMSNRVKKAKTEQMLHEFERAAS